MRIRGFIMLGLAALLAVTATIFAKGWVTQQRAAAHAAVQVVEEQVPTIDLIKVVVARVPLRFGNRLQPEHVMEVDWPANAVPAGTFNSVQELLAGDPRAVLQAIEPNEPILAGKISGGGERASLSALIAPDKRAATIRVNDILGVAGFVLPGDHVDLMLTRVVDTEPVTDVLLQKVRVLGIDQDANVRREEVGVAKSITFELDTHQVQKITLATRVGQLSLALRHVAEVEVGAAERITLSDLNLTEAITVDEPANEDDKPAAPVAEVKPVETVTVDSGATIAITRGTKRREYKVDPEDLG